LEPWIIVALCALYWFSKCLRLDLRAFGIQRVLSACFNTPPLLDARVRQDVQLYA
jgi:hypothetical protein